MGDGLYKAGELYWGLELEKTVAELGKEDGFIPNFYGNIQKFFCKESEFDDWLL